MESLVRVYKLCLLIKTDSCSHVVFGEVLLG